MRRRTRRPFPWRPVLFGVLILNVVVGMLYSPLTALRRVRIAGAREFDKPRLERIALRLRGVPCAQVNPRVFESDVLTLPETRSADLSRSIFGSAALRVGYRRPVARLDAAEPIGITIEGVIYPSDSLPEGLPRIRIRRENLGLAATIATNLETSGLAKLSVEAAQRLQDLQITDPITIYVKERSIVCLNIGSGTVVLGSLDAMDEKLDVLRDELKREPDLLRRVKYLNLVSPKNPVRGGVATPQEPKN